MVDAHLWKAAEGKHIASQNMAIKVVKLYESYSCRESRPRECFTAPMLSDVSRTCLYKQLAARQVFAH